MYTHTHTCIQLNVYIRTYSRVGWTMIDPLEPTRSLGTGNNIFWGKPQ